MIRRLKLFLFSLVPVVVLVILLEGFFRIIGYDFEEPTRKLASVPVYYQSPTVPVGEAFYRRPGPRIWTGRVISQELLRRGAREDLPLYRDEPTITVTYDRDGFRNAERLTDWEVVVVGDSFVEAGYLSQEELHTTLLAERLNIQVRNLGTAHVGPLTYVAYLQSFGKAKSTAHAVMVFYEGNDLSEMISENSRLQQVRSGAIVHEDRLKARKPQTSLIKAGFRALRSIGNGPRRPRSFRNASFVPQRGRRIPITVYSAPPASADLDPQTEKLFGSTLADWAATASALEMKPWVLYMPCKLRVLYPHVDFESRAQRKFADWTPTDLPLYVERACRRAGIGFIDATPYLQAETRAGNLTFNAVFDAHLNGLGSARVADALFDALRDYLRSSRKPASRDE